MSGEKKGKGLTTIDLKIFNLTKKFNVIIVDRENFDYDILVGLDAIKEFRLCQDHKLTITQADPSSVCQYKNNNNSAKNATVHWNEAISTGEFEAKVSHLKRDQQKIIYSLLDKHETIFAKNTYDIGTVNQYEAHMKLSENRYVSRKPYRCSYDDQREIEKQIAELLNYGLIEQSSSPFASPVTLAYKKTGEGGTKEKNRLCIDFRELNKLLIPECQPFPLIEDLLVRTRDCCWFSALDINSAFWSIPLRPKDRYKTGFVTQHGHWQWRVLPFGLKNSPAIFQRILSGIIRRNKMDSFCCNYIDDILIFSRSFEEHIKHLDILFNAIKQEGFKLKFIKCKFAAKSVQYLGHIISQNEVQPLHDNLTAIKKFPQPQNRKNIRQFLGKVNFYHKYIPNSSKMLEPFHNLLRKDVEFLWSNECETAFEKIKDYLTSNPVLAIFHPDLPTRIYTDASGEGIGAVLKQVQSDGTEKSVAFFSKKLNEAQKKKKAIYIELYAVREAVRYWRYWLIGRKFTVVTDHKPLHALNLRSRTDEELGDIANYLLQYDFDIVYRPGDENLEADCLSRNPVLSSSFSPDMKDPIRTVNVLQISDIQSSQSQIIHDPKIKIENGIKYRIDGIKKRIVLDDDGGRLLIERTHLKYGHIGSRQMINTIKNHYFFPKMYKRIIAYCSKCEVCILNKTRRRREIGHLGHLGPAKEPYEIMSLDTVGGFNGYNSPKKYLHLLIDHFTRFAFMYASSGQSSSDFIRLVDSVETEHHISRLLSDQYGGLCSSAFKDYLQAKGIEHLFTAVDSPSSNGMVERLNQSLVNRIRCKMNEQKKKKAWTTVASQCLSEYNNSIHSSTGYSPNYLLNGVPPFISPVSSGTTLDLPADRSRAYENSLRSHYQNKKRYDLRKSEYHFRTGDLVYVENGNRLNRGKLDGIRIGPFPIMRHISNTVYELDVGCNKPDKRLYHVSKLLPLSY